MNKGVSSKAQEYHSTIDWNSWRRPREIERVDDRAFEILQALRAAGIDDYLSGKVISEIIMIESGKKFASNAGGIVKTLQAYGGAIEKKLDGTSLRFRSMTTATAIKPSAKARDEVDANLVTLCDRFHRAGSHIAKRRKGKQPIDFSDEYDVQDAFGLVLKCMYESVKDEEWTPSYAGSASRIDFIIEDIETAAELKLARDNHKVGDELIVDIGRYRTRADINTLVCFIYDPDGHLRRDAAELEKTLSGIHAQDSKSIAVRVIIRPH